MEHISLLLILAVGISLATAKGKPNIVFVITDEQGYGDLAHNGHPYVKTPAIDKLHSESVALDDYHVAPTCSPTRCGLLTGHWTNRTGVWHTVNGRSMLRGNEITIASLLKEQRLHFRHVRGNGILVIIIPTARKIAASMRCIATAAAA